MSVTPSEGEDDRRGSGGYAVGGEDVVVWSRVAGEPLDELGTNSDRQLRTDHLGAGEMEDLILVCCGEMHQLVRQLVVVLQGMH